MLSQALLALSDRKDSLLKPYAKHYCVRSSPCSTCTTGRGRLVFTLLAPEAGREAVDVHDPKRIAPTESQVSSIDGGATNLHLPR